jgi:hypothetical protein
MAMAQKNTCQPLPPSLEPYSLKSKALTLHCRATVLRRHAPLEQTRAGPQGMRHVSRLLHDACSFCYTRNGLDVKPLLSHGGLECIAAVIDSHMRHQGTPLRACAAGLLVCLFVCLQNAAMPRGRPTRRAECNGPCIAYCSVGSHWIAVRLARDCAAGMLQSALTLLSPMVSSAASATSRDTIVAAERCIPAHAPECITARITALDLAPESMRLFAARALSRTAGACVYACVCACMHACVCVCVYSRVLV